MNCSGDKSPSFLKMRNLYLASVGNAIECYDFFLYVLLGALLGKLFFPALDASSGFIATLFIYAIGYFIRPVGAIFWGYIADKYGRKKVFVGTITIMSCATFAIACLPTYTTIGIFAPVMLMTLRSLQGFSYSGEVPTFAAYLYEISSIKNRGLYSSVMTFAGCLGVLLAICLYALLNLFFSYEQLLDWAWRIPFFISSIAIIIISYMRANMKETLKIDNNSKSIQNSPIVTALRENLAQVVKVFLFISVAQICFTSYTAYTTIFISKYVATNYQQSLSLSAMSMVYILCFLPIMGFISDKVGLKRFLFYALGAVFIGSPIVYINLLNATSFIHITLMQILYAMICAALLAPTPSFLISTINGKARVTIYGVAQNFAVALVGGNTPLVHEALARIFGYPAYVSIYVMAFSMIAFYILLFHLTTKQRGLSNVN